MLETLVRRRGLVRLTLVPLALLAMVGCTGLIGDGGGGGDDGVLITPEEQAAQDAFINKAAPALRNATCTSCHATMVPMFLAGADDLEMRAALLAYDPPVINLDAPSSSRILNKGMHSGPALNAAPLGDILEWIRAEKDAQPDPGPTEIPLDTEPFTVQLCTSGVPSTPPDPPNPTCPLNTVSLQALGVDAKLEFAAPAVGSSLYLNRLTLTGGAAGVYIEHPLFVSHPADAEPVADLLDRYNATKINLMAAETSQIEGGTASFADFAPNNPISLHFKVVQAYQPDTTPPAAGGCKVLASFKQNAQQLMQTNCANACHGGANTNAQSAMNLMGLLNTPDDVTLQAACDEVLTRVNLIAPDQSSIFLAPTPNNPNHDFTFNNNATNFNAYKTSVLVWINAEKTAP
jgi:hypothetical protein